MVSNRSSRRLIAGAIALCIALTACGSDDSSKASPSSQADSPATSAEASAPSEPTEETTAPVNTTADTATTVDGLTEALQIVAEARGQLSFDFAGPAFDVSSAQGKNVWFVNIDEQFEILVNWRKAAQAELERLGATVTVFDGKSDIAEWGRGIDQAVAANADLIVTVAIPSDLVLPQLDAAKAAGVPVVTVIGSNPAIPGPSQYDAVAVDVTFDYAEVGRLLGAWFVADSDGKGTAVAFAPAGQPSGDTEAGAMIDEIKRLCPECSVRLEDAQPASWFDGSLQTLTKSIVQSETDVDYLLPAFDSMTVGIDPALTETDAGGRVRVGSFNAQPPFMQLMADGGNLQMDIGGPNEWFAMAIADSILRVLAGEKPVADHGIGFRIFDADNIEGLDLSSEDSVAWYGVDFVAEYRKLWMQ